MATLNQLQKKVNQIKPDKLFRIIIKTFEKLLIGYNIGQLYNGGLNAKGERIKHSKKSYSVYSKAYTRKKEKAGQYQGFIDLHFLGSYYKGWVLKFDKEGFYVQAGKVLIKRFNLTEHFRDVYPDFEGIIPDNLAEFTDKYFKPEFQKLVREQIGI